MVMHRLNRSVITLLLAIVPAGAQGPAPRATQDPAVGEVRKVIEEAQKEIAAFRESGGKNEDSKHPAVKWLSLLWQYREKYPGTEAAGLATAEALHLLFHSDRGDEVLALMDTLTVDDAAWERLPNVLNELANQRKDASLLTGRLERIAKATTDARIRASALLAHGRSIRSTDTAQATVLLERVVREAPGSPAAREADSLLYDIANLSLGKPAPAFSAKPWKSAPLSLAGYKNQALVIVFWAST